MAVPGHLLTHMTSPLGSEVTSEAQPRVELEDSGLWNKFRIRSDDLDLNWRYKAQVFKLLHNVHSSQLQVHVADKDPGIVFILTDSGQSQAMLHSKTLVANPKYKTYLKCCINFN